MENAHHVINIGSVDLVLLQLSLLESLFELLLPSDAKCLQFLFLFLNLNFLPPLKDVANLLVSEPGKFPFLISKRMAAVDVPAASRYIHEFLELDRVFHIRINGKLSERLSMRGDWRINPGAFEKAVVNLKARLILFHFVQLSVNALSLGSH